MTSIWGTDDADAWQLLVPSQFPAEKVLHDLVEQAPHMLPLAGSPQLTILGREVQLGAGRADLLAVENTGRLVIIEVKLFGNADARRAVVAQVLSYAAYLQGLHPELLETQIVAPHLRARGADTVLGAVGASDQQLASDPHAFNQGLARSLAEGDFRLVLVLDNAPDELVQVVGYLQLIAGNLLVDLITLSAYEVNGSRILVPQRIEPDRRSAQLSDAEASARQAKALIPGSEEFRAAVANAASGEQNLLNRLATWAEGLRKDGLVRLFTFRGKEMTTLLPRLFGDDVGLVTIYCDSGRGYLQFWRSVFDRRAATALQRIEARGYEVRQGNTTRDISDELLDLLSSAYREASASAAKPG